MSQPYNPNPPQPDLPYPGPFPSHKKPRRWPWIAGVVVAFLFGIAIGGAGGTQAPTEVTAQAGQPTVTIPGATVTLPPVVKTVTRPGPTVKVTETQKPPESADVISGDGTYEVGVDIKPGKYKAQGGDGCYWARRSSLDGDFGSIIANNLSDGPQTVTIKRSDKAFETARCGEWRKVG